MQQPYVQLGLTFTTSSYWPGPFTISSTHSQQPCPGRPATTGGTPTTADLNTSSRNAWQRQTPQ